MQELVLGICRMLRERKMKQSELAREAGYTRAQLCDMLHGRKVIRADDMFRIADAIGCTADELRAAGEETEKPARRR